jgi:hypothetical protein
VESIGKAKKFKGKAEASTGIAKEFIGIHKKS